MVQIGIAVIALLATAGFVLREAQPAGKHRARKADRDRGSGPGRKTRRWGRGRRARTAIPVGGGAGALDVAAALRAGPDAPLALPVPVGVESIQAAGERAAQPGMLTLRPDPDRLIQHEVVEVGGTFARISSLVRLITWVILSGVAIAIAVLAAVRGIALFFERVAG